MSLDFTHSVIIHRPAREVFAYLADFENNPHWQRGMVSCRWTSEQTMEVGSTYVQEAKFLGKRIDTHFRVTEVKPGQSISIESTQSTFPIQVTRSVEHQDQHACLVKAHIRGQPEGVLRLFSGLVKRSVAKDYAQLKRHLEAPQRA